MFLCYVVATEVWELPAIIRCWYSFTCRTRLENILVI